VIKIYDGYFRSFLHGAPECNGSEGRANKGKYNILIENQKAEKKWQRPDEMSGSY
jgi:hypothetical protein